MEQIQSSEERRDCDDMTSSMGTVIFLASFGLGFLTAAVVTLLTTPESGTKVRMRLKRGLETARQELDEVVGETREAWNRVSDNSRDAVKRTTTRVQKAAQVTKEALAKGELEHAKAP